MALSKKNIIDPDILILEIEKASVKHRVWHHIILAVASVVMSLVYLWLLTDVLDLDLPKTTYLKRKNAELRSRIEVLNSRMDGYEESLDRFRKNDELVYRALFGLSPVPLSERVGGYESFSQLSDAATSNSLLVKTSDRLDMLMNMSCAQSCSFDEIATVSKMAGDIAMSIPSVPPVNPDPSTYRFTSPFGFRSDPISGRPAMHTGVDFAFSPGNPIYATGDGVVESATFQTNGYGNCVVVNHGFGYKSRYAHMSVIYVVEGMKVGRGDCLGESGCSGKATGPHLHYEVEHKGVKLNPLNFMDLSMNPEEYMAMVEKRAEETGAVLVKPEVIRKRKGGRR